MMNCNYLRYAWPFVTFLLLLVTVSEANQEVAQVEKSFEEHTNQSLLWGAYRPNCYFGMRPRNVNQSPLIMGLMWFDNSEKTALSKLRHFADQNDKMKKYSWELYDPRHGGKEVIIDPENNLNMTLFLTKSPNGENWSVRVQGRPLDPSKKTTASIIAYFNQNGEDQVSQLVKVNSPDPNNVDFLGLSKEMGEYEITIKDNYGKYFRDLSRSRGKAVLTPDSSRTSHMSFRIPDADLWKVRDVFQSLLTSSINKVVEEYGTDFSPMQIPGLFTISNIYNFNPGNFHFVQKTFDNSLRKGFEFDITFNMAKSSQKISSRDMVTNSITRTLDQIRVKFFRQISSTLPIDYQYFAMETLSNLLGGIGYFYGTQIVDRATQLDEDQFESMSLEQGKEEGPFSLFTSVPSRAFFPRGFYWDEGFQLLQIMEYDFDLAFEIMSSWFDMIEDDSGWIAREVILGAEARSRVPPEFTVQSPYIANPPTLLLTFSEMLTRAIDYQDNMRMAMADGDVDGSIGLDTNQLLKNAKLLVNYANKIYPKLLKHYEWFRSSQKGLVEEYLEIFEDEGIQDKVHLDETYRWSGRTVKHCLPSGLDDYPRAQPPDVAELNVDTLAWVGVMTRSMRQIAHVLRQKEDEAKYEQIEKKIVENLDTLHWSNIDKCYCDVTIDDYYGMRKFVCHKGYISLLPFALKLVPRDSPKLAEFVALMGDKDKIFSDFGLLSLSKQDEYFGKDENYWRGPIWMNINYLCLDALRYYYPEVTQELAGKKSTALILYQHLKENLITNIYRVWKNTGFCYENYDPNDGHGTGAEQFTGWTALVVNLLGRF